MHVKSSPEVISGMKVVGGNQEPKKMGPHYFMEITCGVLFTLVTQLLQEIYSLWLGDFPPVSWFAYFSPNNNNQRNITDPDSIDWQTFQVRRSDAFLVASFVELSERNVCFEILKFGCLLFVRKKELLSNTFS